VWQLRVQWPQHLEAATPCAIADVPAIIGCA